MKYRPGSGLKILAVLFLGAAMTQPTIGNTQAAITDFGPVGAGETVTRPGAIVWMDLLTTDVQRAATFYREVLGWDFRFSVDQGYAYATLDGRPVASIAAFDENPDDTNGIWIPSISTPDVDGAMAIVRSKGGNVIAPPEDLTGRGRYALIEDATGAAIMLLNARGGDPGRIEAPNQWFWVELWTDDVGVATGFYEAVAGYRTIAIKDTGGQEFMVMGRDQQPHASVLKTPLPDVDPTWLAYLLVEDIDHTCETILKAGGSILVAPRKDGFNDDIAIVADPTGGVFALQQKETGR